MSHHTDVLPIRRDTLQELYKAVLAGDEEGLACHAEPVQAARMILELPASSQMALESIPLPKHPLLTIAIDQVVRDMPISEGEDLIEAVQAYADIHARVAVMQYAQANSNLPAPSADDQVSALRHSGLSIDGDNAYKRDLIDSIVGALAFGKQGVNPPPAGNWGQQFWDIGRAEGEEKERLINQRDAILLQARVWAGEAKGQQAITREVGEILGGVPNWGPIAVGVEALRQQLDDAVTALNEICRVSRIGEKPFEIATLAIGEMCASAEPAEVKS